MPPDNSNNFSMESHHTTKQAIVPMERWPASHAPDFAVVLFSYQQRFRETEAPAIPQDDDGDSRGWMNSIPASLPADTSADTSAVTPGSVPPEPGHVRAGRGIDIRGNNSMAVMIFMCVFFSIENVFKTVFQRCRVSYS